MYACNIDNCTKAYKHPKSLREHKQSKHQKKRYRCDVDGCNESVAQKKNLKRHKESRHNSFASDPIPFGEPPSDQLTPG
jgi:hypothetical protein